MYNLRIDVLRGISIVLVLLHHFNIPYKLPDTWLGFQIFGESFSTLLARNGNYGVTLFFVISGFLITGHSLRRQENLAQLDVKAFYIRRIARIIPCLLLLLLIVTGLGSLGLAPFLNHAPQQIEVSDQATVLAALGFYMNLLIIQYGWVNYALGVLWSLSVEEVFYLFFPILCIVTRRRSLLVVVLLAVIAYAPYFRSLYYLNENEAYLYHYFASFDAIAFGCLSALLASRVKLPQHSVRWLGYLCMGLMCVLYLYAPIKQVSTWSMSVFAILAAILLWVYDQPRVLKKTNKLTQACVWLGQHSYELYLFHLIVLGLIKVMSLPAETPTIFKLPLLLLYLT